MSIERGRVRTARGAQGASDIIVGDVLDPVLAVFLFNKGIIVRVQPVPLGDPVLRFYPSVYLITVAFIAVTVWRPRVPRWEGATPAPGQVPFVTGGYMLLI